MKGLRILLLGLAIGLASGMKAQFYDSADDIYYYVECNSSGQPLENGSVTIFNFDGIKACDLAGFLRWKIGNFGSRSYGCNVEDVKRNMQTSVTYYEDKVENTDYKLKYISGNKYQGAIDTYSWTAPNGSYCWDKETHTFDFSYDRKTMTDNIEEKSHMGTNYSKKQFKRVDKSFFRVGRSRTPSGTMHE